MYFPQPPPSSLSVWHPLRQGQGDQRDESPGDEPPVAAGGGGHNRSAAPIAAMTATNSDSTTVLPHTPQVRGQARFGPNVQSLSGIRPLDKRAISLSKVITAWSSLARLSK